MATTGFWPVKGRLKQVINYAENPDKTTDREYLDNDLYNALRYAEDDRKTDEKMYVTAINCPTKRAYEHMMATKTRYGKLGGNVAYHGYQSFRTGEVTPEQAHRIGLESARRMWGKEYEIVVTTHLNTDNVHNHIVVNSVSFRTGRKFENHKSDHYRLREISDAVCREHGLEVLPPKKFSGNRKKEHWIHQRGGMTHRDILRQDMERILESCTNSTSLVQMLRGLGYQVGCTYERKHISVKAPGWERAVRLSSIGYTDEVLGRRMQENRWYPQRGGRVYAVRVRTSPLLQMEKNLEFEIEHSSDGGVVLIDVLFYLLLQLMQLSRSEEEFDRGNRPHSAAIRLNLFLEQDLKEEYGLMRQQGIHTETDLLDFIDSRVEEIATLEQLRQEIRNSNRRPKTPQERQEKNARAGEITKELRPLRKDLKKAQRALSHYPEVWNLLREERNTELKAKVKERNYER